MGKIIFVTGGQGEGKSTFIEQHYLEKEGHYIFDLAKLNVELHGDYASFLSNEDKQMVVWNKATGDCLEAFMDGANIVVEYCLGAGHDEEIKSWVDQCKKLEIETQWAQVTCKTETAKKRIEKAWGTPDYFSSINYMEDTITVFTGILESIQMTKNLGYMDNSN